jgi:hypothetical protein
LSLEQMTQRNLFIDIVLNGEIIHTRLPAVLPNKEKVIKH